MVEQMTLAKKRRPTQAERSAGTRARVLKAAIRCLYTRGYSATTTLLVADEAKISRGAMLHQFPTKTDLMLFVVRSVYEDSNAKFKKRQKEGKSTQADLAKLAWESVSGPAGIAALEVMIGSRSDRDLASQLVPLQRQIEQDAIASSSMELGASKSEHATTVRLFYWALRGLSIANLLTETPKEISQALELLVKVIATYQESEGRKLVSK